MMIVFMIVLFAVVFALRRPENPRVVPEHAIQANLTVPPRIDGMLRRACYDCHSSETHWPWYSRLIEHDVVRARMAMNFSEWSTGAGRKPGRAQGTLTAACAAVQARVMPKAPYSVFHPEAKLSDEEVQAFCEWTRATVTELRASAAAQAR